MNTWSDIHDLSEKILKRIFLQENIHDHVIEENEKDCLPFGKIEGIVERLNDQYKYDASKAYQYWKHYKRRKLIRCYGIAAGILLLLGLGGIWWSQSDFDEVERIKYVETISSGGKKAVLTLADGSVWHIKDSAMIISTAHETIRIDTNGILLENQEQMKDKIVENYHLLSVPRGGEFNMTLSDGTQVWINSESELSFPAKFTNGQRVVRLKGEAYFKVQKDTLHPFIVELVNSKIEVLGTSFNVRSYKDEYQVVTTLTEGTIAFETENQRVMLLPGDQTTLDHTGCIVKEKVDVYPFIAWIEGRFIFRKQRLEDIMKTVSRWYKVNIHFEDEEAKAIFFSGGMMRYEGFETFMKMIEMTGSVKCRIESNNVFIAKRK